MINCLEPDFSDLPGRRALPRNYKRGDSVFEHIDVSVITPYYNTEELFVETFVSLQAQSLQNWEWVIVDDGSTDEESVKRLVGVTAKDKRIKVIRQENAGPGAARNNAFRNTSGRYVCLLDSDDMVEPTYLEKCVWFLDSNPEFAFCNACSVVFGNQEYLWTTGFERGKTHLQANSGPSFAVVRRSAYEGCGGFDESIRFGHEDWDFWLAMAKAGHWGYTIREFLLWYRKRGDGRFEKIMRSGNVNEEFERRMHRKYEGLDKHFPEPVRRHPAPYETIETNSAVSNSLSANPSGRRIMFILPWMTTGGADRVNLDLIEGLTAKGHDITICATLPADHHWEHQFSRFTPDIFILPNILHASDYPRFLAYLIQSRKIDTVVITGSTIGYYFLPYLRAVSPGVAFVDMCHAEEPHWLNGGHPRFGVGYQDALELNIVTNRHLARWMKNRGADGGRIRVMYTGVRVSQSGQPDEVRSSVRSELNIPEDTPLIVFAGRICEQKRPFLLADILRAARDQGLIFRALIIGDGELKAQLKDLLGQYHLADHVQMLASVPHQRWLDILIASDIFLMPSQYEGISIALLESMAAGVVPVVADVGGHDEIVTRDAGVLIPQGDNELREYLDAIRRLLSHSAKLQQMSKQGKALAALKLSWEGMIDNFLALLDEAHQLRIDHPRYPISQGFGRELATLSLECKRLGETADWLWNTKPPSSTADTALLTTPPEVQAVARFAILLSRTWLGRIVIHNRFLKAIGKKLLKRLEYQGVA
ncbi:MAG: glycosyltransferase [Deltaproteobacteria bacterium]|nr:glycosyltransferase [Deltaproteobacteria bacterium]